MDLLNNQTTFAPITTSRLLIDHDPMICLLFNDNMEIIDCNQEAFRSFGYETREALLTGFQAMLTENAMNYRPGGREPFYLRVMQAIDTGCETFETEFTIKGKVTRFDAVVKRVPYENSHAAAAYLTQSAQKIDHMRDLQSLMTAEVELEMHARLLQAVNEIATQLISSGPETFNTSVETSLEILAHTVHVDRVYIWENFKKEGKLFCRQLYEWVDNVKPQRSGALTPILSYDDLPYWRSRFEVKEAINGPVSSTTPVERQILEDNDVRSVLMLPLHINGQFWGFIGFDDCHQERAFPRIKEQVLEAAGILIVSSIERNKMTQQSIDAWIEVLGHEKLLHAVNDVARLLLGANENICISQTVHHAMKILGDCTGADRVSIWRNIADEDGQPGSVRMVVYNANQSYDPDQLHLNIDCEVFIPGWYKSWYDVNVDFSQLKESTREHPIFSNCRSLLVLPISIHGNFWGFIVMMHTRGLYLYNETEKGILRSGGMLIASGVVRDEITQSYVEARENALASARSKSEFLSRMSHEIRTPMNAIIGMTTLAKKSNDMQKVKHYLETVDASSQQLLSIINDVLDMSKIDANKLEIVTREFEFEEMIRHVINVNQVKVNEKKLDLRLELPTRFSRMIISDELRLSQVLINLMSNAIKFTPEFGVITLRVVETPIDADRSNLRMEIIDTGIGIKPELIPHVFESFEQADGSITRQFGGTGLGLAICKRIIHLMNGEIGAVSDLGKGSTFYIDVEVGWGGSLPHSSDGHSLRTGLRILVVDDAPEVLEYFKNTLEQFNQECETAIDSRDAISLVTSRLQEQRPYDVVFLDWHMPVKNGGQTAREIRQIMGEGVRLVLISNADWSDIEQFAIEAGVKDYLPKPVLPSDLYNKLVEITGAAEAARVDDHDNEAVYDWSGQCILLAEDIEINREIMAGILEDTGIIIDNAADGREAVAMFTANPTRYKLILMDVQMPVLDGLNATRQIRASGLPNAKTIPIVAMTANAFKEDEKASLEAGMNGHIAKPIDIPSLMKVLGNALI